MSDRSVIIRKFENQIASYSDYLSGLQIKLCRIYNSKSKEIIPGMEYEKCVDIDKKNLNGITCKNCDFLKDTKPENRIDNLKKFLKFNNISYETGLWN